MGRHRFDGQLPFAQSLAQEPPSGTVDRRSSVIPFPHAFPDDVTFSGQPGEAPCGFSSIPAPVLRLQRAIFPLIPQFRSKKPYGTVSAYWQHRNKRFDNNP